MEKMNENWGWAPITKHVVIFIRCLQSSQMTFEFRASSLIRYSTFFSSSSSSSLFSAFSACRSLPLRNLRWFYACEAFFHSSLKRFQFVHNDSIDIKWFFCYNEQTSKKIFFGLFICRAFRFLWPMKTSKSK